MSKYEDLMVDIKNDDTFDMTRSELAGARVALQWLDQNVGQVPGRTITADRYRQVQKMDGGYIRGYDDALIDTGTVVLPEPEPTNAELIERKLRELREEPGEWMTYATDSDICGFARALDKAGVIAPEGENDGR